MRGTDEVSRLLCSDVELEARIPTRHPLRKLRQGITAALTSADDAFSVLHTDCGRTTRPKGYALSIRRRKGLDLRREKDPPDRFLLGQNHRWTPQTSSFVVKPSHAPIQPDKNVATPLQRLVI